MKTESTQMNTEENVGWFKQNYVALTTIWIKECTRFLRIWVQTLVPPAITMSLYFVIFGSLIGNRIGEMGGFTYMEFCARPYYDVGDHKLLRQRVLFIF